MYIWSVLFSTRAHSYPLSNPDAAVPMGCALHPEGGGQSWRPSQAKGILVSLPWRFSTGNLDRIGPTKLYQP